MLKDHKALELDKILLQLANETTCPDAAELAQKIEPDTDIRHVERLLQETDDAFVLMAKYGAPSFYGMTNVTNALRRAEAGGVLNLADGFTMPRYSAEWDAAVQQIEAALTESRSAVTSADPWDSTVAYAFGDPVHCGLLYGVPDGMGIQFDEAAYLTDPAHEIHSRYVLTAADTPTAARLQADDWTVLYESDRGVLYEHGTM